MKTDTRKPPYYHLAWKMAIEAMGPSKFYNVPAPVYNAMVKAHAEKILEAMRYGYELGTLAQIDLDAIPTALPYLAVKDGLLDALWNPAGLDPFKRTRIIEIIDETLKYAPRLEPYAIVLQEARDVIENSALSGKGEWDTDTGFEILNDINSILYKGYFQTKP